MKIDISPLLLHRCDNIDLNEVISFELDEKQKKSIKALNDIDVNVHLYKDDFTNIYLDIEIIGNMILECVRTRVDVKYPFETKYSTSLEEIYAENQKSIEKLENVLDITQNLWQNIVVEVPLRVVADNISEENIYGDGWKLVSDTDEDESIDPRLEKLKELL